MRKYLATVKLGWLDAIEYRTEFFISIIGWGIRLFIGIFLWDAVAQARGGAIGNYTFSSIMSYFFMIQIISSFIFSRVGFDIVRDIYRGDLSNFLLKPINYLGFRLMHEMSRNLVRLFFSFIIFGALLFIYLDGISFSLWKLVLAPLAMMGAYFISFCMVALIAVSSFWITNSNRLMFIYFGILMTFSGMLIPIDLFPEAYRTIFEKLPFAYIFYFPAKVMQNSAFESSFMVSGFIFQWIYVIAFGGLLYFIYSLGLRKFEAVGR